MTLRFQPSAGHHAIQVCTVVVRFAAPADPSTMARILQMASDLAAANNLPATQQMMTMGTPEAAPAAAYQRYASNGTVVAELRCEAQQVLLQIREYNGWKALVKDLQNTLLRLVPLYLAGLPAILNVLMQYDDRFDAVEGGDISAAEVFRSDSSWIAPRHISSEQPWHCHTGGFTEIDDSRRRLINVNVTCNDQLLHQVDGPRRIVGLTLLVAENYDRPSGALILEPGNAAPALLETLTEIHDAHKAMLSELLSDDYLNAIGCGASA